MALDPTPAHAHADTHPARAGGHGGAMHRGAYGRLALMLLLSFIAMYLLMYAMVDRLSNVHNSLNEAWMAGLMTAPMGLLELGLMSKMYPHAGRNLAIAVGCLLLGLLCWVGIRQQVGIGDRQFLRSMVPHHAGALLMCREAKLTDGELRALCQAIIESQQREIDQMHAILARLDAR